jgi:alpha-glucoside transport system substrate-binding protein
MELVRREREQVDERRPRPTSMQRNVVRRLAFGLAVTVGAAVALTWATVTAGPGRGSSDAVASVLLTPGCGGDLAPHTDPVRGGRPLDGSPIVVAGAWAGVEEARFKALLHDFEVRTGVPVVYARETHDIADTLEARVAHHCPPDVALLPQPGLLEDFARAHRLQPLDRSTTALVRRNYAPDWVRLGSAGGELYGVWLKAADKSTFWYRRSVFKAAGLGPPATWPQLAHLAARLRSAGIAPFAVAGADGWPLTDWFENVYLRTAGPAKYDALASGRLSWKDKTVKYALERLAVILNHPGWLAGGTLGARTTTFERSVADVFSQTRSRAAMVFEGDFVASLIPRALAGDTGTFDFPDLGPTHRVVVGGDVAVMFTASAAARALMRYLATPEAAVPWARAGGFISPNRLVDPDVYPDPTTRRLAEDLNRAGTLRFDLSDLQPTAFGAKAGQGMWDIFQRYLVHRGQVNIDATAQHLEWAASAARQCERGVAGFC